MTSIDGLVTGLDTTSIINQLMQLERMPQTRLAQRQADARKVETELRGMRSDVQAIRTMASDLRLSSGWNQLSATSSAESVTVAAGSGTITGSLQFQVLQTAAAKTIYSNETVGSLNDVVASSGSVFSYQGTSSLGFDNLSATGFAEGAIGFEVTQASEGASITGVAATVPATIDGTNDTITVEVNGASHTVTLTHDTYDDADQLASAINNAIAQSGAVGLVSAGASDTGEITLTTSGEGSAATLNITGGTAVTTGALGLTAGSSATGVDGIVVVDGVSNTITDTTATGPVTLNGSSGTITADLSGPIRTGTADVEQVGFGGGTLAEVVETINGAGGLGYSAVALNTGSGYRLQLTAKETGAASSVDLDTSGFTGFTGFTTLTEGRDAQIQLQGTNPYTISSSSNTFEDLMPGVDVTVSQVTTTPVTVTVGEDNEAVADKVEELVNAINEFLSRADSATAANPGGDPALLFGNSAVRRTREALIRSVTSGVNASSFGAASLAGITVTREGTLEFNRAEFIDASQSDREELERLFTAPGGAGEPGILDRVITAADEATSAGSGRLWSEAEATKSRIERWGDQIDAYEVRFDRREATLRRQYAALEVALGGLQEQSSYLAGQLASLPTVGGA